jgi:two-component system sensor kinase FixL
LNKEVRLFIPYAAAAAAAATAMALHMLLENYFEGRTFTVIYVPVVVFAAFVGGRGPAILATLLCIIGSLAIVGGRELLLHPANVIDLSFFAVVGPVLGLMGDRLLKESDRARERQAHLQSILDTVPEAMILQRRSYPAVRMERHRSHRQERLNVDAVSIPLGARWLSRPLPTNW